MQIFISYARTDRPKVDRLAQQLRQVGNDVWVDIDLSGGQVWWDNILDQIRRADAFVAVVSRSSVKSQACQVERQYAGQLGKPILPLTVEALNAETLPSDISRLEIVDYSRPDETAAFRLIGAVNRLPTAPPLPNPLPRSPDAPSSYWGNIGDQVNAASLNLDQQLAVVGRIEGAFAPTADPVERPVALELLNQMQRRSDLYAAVDRRIALLMQSINDDDHHTRTHTERPDPKPAEDPAGDAAASASSTPSSSATPTSSSTPRPSGTTAAAATAGAAPPAAGYVTVSPHWAMAIFALIFFFPTGIPAVVYAARVKPSLAASDLATAKKASSRVVMFFWISMAIVVLYVIGIAAGGSSGSNGALTLLSRSWL
ncbi:MAG TPA: TIR domain-containing protein [Streptosporangiaceae bacterium]|nr:TIR domain-containing protein [Streptosporangiaceae bacterium]